MGKSALLLLLLFFTYQSVKRHFSLDRSKGWPNPSAFIVQSFVLCGVTPANQKSCLCDLDSQILKKDGQRQRQTETQTETDSGGGCFTFHLLLIVPHFHGYPFALHQISHVTLSCLPQEIATSASTQLQPKHSGKLL